MSKIKSHNILVVGDIMLDKYVIGSYSRRSPEADIPLLDYSYTEERLGGAANVALNLKQLGQRAYLIGIIGNDEAGSALTRLCKKEKINNHCLKISDRPTTLKTRFVDKKFQQYLRLDYESKKYLKGKNEQKLISKIKSIVREKRFDAIIIQDYNKGVVTNNIIHLIQDICKKDKILLCVDPKRKFFKLLSACDVFKPNLNEVIIASKEHLQPTKKSLSTSSYISSLKSKHLFVTLASKGIYHASKSQSILAPGHRVKNADVSGAGDTVISALAVLYCMQLNLNIMAEIANKVGAKICSKKGVSALSKKELEQIIKKKS